MKRIFTHNWGLKVVSIFLALTIWWLIRAEMDKSRENQVPFEPQFLKKNREITIQK